MRVKSKRRFGRVIGLKPEMEEEYRTLHATIWPDIKALMKKFHLENYSIYLSRFPDGRCLLFCSFEYAGDDFEADMKQMDAHPRSGEWAARCEACQLPLETRHEGEWWSSMEEVFYLV
jgi:L-rhamnose mutarotase